MPQVDLSDELKAFQSGHVLSREQFTPEFQANMVRSFSGLRSPEQNAQPSVGENQMVIDKKDYERLQNYEKVVKDPRVLPKIGEALLGNEQRVSAEVSQPAPQQYQQPVQQPQPQQTVQQPAVQPAPQGGSVASDGGGQNDADDPWMNLFNSEEENKNPQPQQPQPQPEAPQPQPVQQQQYQPQPQAQAPNPQQQQVQQFQNALTAECVRQGLDPAVVMQKIQSDFSVGDLVSVIRNKMGVVDQPRSQAPQPGLSVSEEETPTLNPSSNSPFARTGADPNSFRI